MNAIVPDGGCMTCTTCERRMPLSCFPRDRTCASGFSRKCKQCKKARRAETLAARTPEQTEARKAKSRERGRARWALDQSRFRSAQLERQKSPEGKRRRMLYCALERAREFGLPFSITLADIVVPEFCPFLGTRLEFGVGKLHANSPSLDRLRPELGYVPGNVIVCSYRANAIKQNATPEELERIAAALRGLLR